MGIEDYCRRGSKLKMLAGATPAWITNNARSPYIARCVLSYPPWVEAADMRMWRAWSDAMTAFYGVPHVLDHIVPLSHPRVCGLSVPWNFQVIRSAANSAKGNRWEPNQLDLFN